MFDQGIPIFDFSPICLSPSFISSVSGLSDSTQHLTKGMWANEQNLKIRGQTGQDNGQQNRLQTELLILKQKKKIRTLYWAK